MNALLVVSAGLYIPIKHFNFLKIKEKFLTNSYLLKIVEFYRTEIQLYLLFTNLDIYL